MGRFSRLADAFRRSARRNSITRRMLWAVLFCVVLILLFIAGLAPERYDLALGQVAPQEIRAPRTVVDRIETERLRQEAAGEIKDVYEQDARVVEEVVTVIKSVFAEVRDIRAMGHEPVVDVDEDNGEDLMEEPDEDTIEARQHEVLAKIEALDDLSSNERHVLLTVGIADLMRIEQVTIAIMRKVMEGGIKEDSLPAFRRQIENEFEAVEIKPTLKMIGSHIAQALLSPNMVRNDDATMERKQRAMESVEPIRVLEGDLIVDEGERVTAWHLAILRELGLERRQTDTRVFAGSILLAVLCVSLVGVYVSQFERTVAEQESLIMLTGLIVILTITMIEVLKPISGYLPPVAAGTMLLAILVGPRLALFIGALIAMVAGILNGYDIRFVLSALIGGTVGVYSVVRVGQRSDLAKTGVFVALANAVAVVVSALLLGGVTIYKLPLWQDIGWSIGNGVFSAVLTIGSLPFFEAYFGIITSVRLLELSNPNQPLLRRLLLETPGTYHHSVMVANLAEAGVEAIGGNSMLARVGSYYHDIGKLKRPYFFIENQIAGDNPHDKISPSLSVLILTSHVRDGIELAREAKLPDTIVEFVREHHGTSLVGFFYSRATENGREDDVPERDFRYEGPRPQSRETAVVMLADSCEAAVRSLAKPTPSRIEAMVRKIIRDKLNDEQLNRCDLTLRDLDVLVDNFVRVLTGVFHPRIEYPEVVEEMQREAGDKDEVAEIGSDQEEKAGKGTTGGKTDNDYYQQSSGQGRSGRDDSGSDPEGSPGRPVC